MDVNLSHPCPAQLSSSMDLEQMLLELLACATASDDHEELLLNVVATCTNVTYYACQVSGVES